MVRESIEALEAVPELLEQRGVPGLSLAYVVGDGPVETRTWGVRSVGDGRPVTPDTVFQAGSVSKVVTAFAALRLAATGRLDLDADVNSVLRSWRLPSVWGWQPVVTTRMLLAHVAGVSSGWGEGHVRTEPVPSLVDELEGRGGGLPVRQETLPGLVWFYCGGGYLLVAQLISDVVGRPFAEAMTELVLEPLGMSASTFVEPLPEAWHDRAARGHRSGEEVPGGWRHCGEPGAAGLWTTPRDLMYLARAVNAGQVPELRRGHPVEPRMGLGPMLTSVDGMDWWSHGGSSTGFECTLAGVTGPGVRFAAAVMTNADGWHGVDGDVLGLVCAGPGPGAVTLTNAFEDVVGAFAELTTDQERLVGGYTLPTGERAEVTAPIGRHGPELFLSLPGQAPVRLWPSLPGRWWIAGLAGTEVVFDPPDGLLLRQYGQEVRAERQLGS